MSCCLKYVEILLSVFMSLEEYIINFGTITMKRGAVITQSIK